MAEGLKGGLTLLLSRVGLSGGDGPRQENLTMSRGAVGRVCVLFLGTERVCSKLKEREKRPQAAWRQQSSSNLKHQRRLLAVLLACPPVPVPVLLVGQIQRILEWPSAHERASEQEEDSGHAGAFTSRDDVLTSRGAKGRHRELHGLSVTCVPALCACVLLDTGPHDGL